jgi:hypothetical protein
MVQITESYTLRAWQPNLKIQLHWNLNRRRHVTLFFGIIFLYDILRFWAPVSRAGSLWFCRYDNEDPDDDCHYFHWLLLWTNMSPELLCTQFQPIVFPEFPFECIIIVCIWKVYSFTIYEIPLRTSSYFSNSWKLAIGKDRISAKIGFKFACDQLTFWSFTVQSLIQV